MALTDADDPDYTIPGFWFIQTQREDFDCDGTYPLEPVVVLAEHLDDALNQADDLIVLPEGCRATGRLIERRATMVELAEWLSAHDAEVADKARREQIEKDAALVERELPEMGAHINVSEYRNGKASGLSFAAAAIRAQLPEGGES